MNLLFIHGNFPGQFLDIAPAMALRCGGRTVFLTQSDNPQNIRLPGVELVRFARHREVRADVHPYLESSERAVLNGQAVLRAIRELVDQGFVPDVVIVHGGNGFGLFVKSILPQCRLISYQEWYFTAETLPYLMPGLTLDQRLRGEMRNLMISEEILRSDAVVCPTAWQIAQFPQLLQTQFTQIFDGINPALFKPVQQADLQQPWCLDGSMMEQPLRFQPGDRVLSYGTRGMEPLRGFPEFMRAAAVAQQQDPALQVVVFGQDRLAYGNERSSHASGSWKQAMLEELRRQLDPSRLHFTGLISYGSLATLFQRTQLHCYFTRPYVVSWGVFQAAACGARVLVNRFKGIDEVFAQPPLLAPVDLDDQSAVTAAVLAGLRQPLDVNDGRSNLPSMLELSHCLEAWWQLLRGQL